MHTAPVLLQVKGLKVAYGGIQAVKGVDFEVREGELVADRLQRRGQDHHHEGHHRAADCRWRNLYLGKSIKGQGAWDLVAEGLVMVPEGAACSPA
jgi:branched-chain amino acid transport system ATP-binding protein